jgi:hypothetical protein
VWISGYASKMRGRFLIEIDQNEIASLAFPPGSTTSIEYAGDRSALLSDLRSPLREPYAHYKSY